MSRQINLLVQVQAAPGFSARRALIGLGVYLLALLGYAVISLQGTARLGDAVALSNTELTAQKAALKTLEQKLGERPKLADIVAQIEVLKAHTTESQEIVNLLRSGAGGGAGYAAQLAALASISEDGVWLTGVKISNAGRTMSIAGRSLRNESVLRYAQRLNERFSAFGAQFTALEMTPETTKEGAAGGTGPALSSVAFRLY